MVYSSAEKAVLELTQAGTPFEQVEQVIQQLPLDEEYKSMLWLFAWAEQPRAHRQAILHSVADQARARDRECLGEPAWATPADRGRGGDLAT